MRSRDRPPAAFFADTRKRPGITPEKIVNGLLRRICDVTDDMNANFESFRGMSCLPSRLAINIHERTKLAGLSSNNCDHQREAQRSRAGEGFRCAADTDPKGQWILYQGRG